jgi:predicted transcriptional regulator
MKKMGNTSIDTQIIGYVSRHPGSSFTDIMRTLSLQESTLRYHLSKFEKKGLLSSRKIGKKRCYFSRTMDFGKDGSHEGLSRQQERVLALIKHQPGISRVDIIAKLPFGGSSVTAILNSLMKKGMVRKVSNEDSTGYEEISRKELKKRIFKQLVIRLVNGEIDELTFKEMVKEIDLMDRSL